LFDQKEKLADKMSMSIYISYLEIYNENAFDLLNADNIDKSFNKWDKVSFYFNEVIQKINQLIIRKNNYKQKGCPGISVVLNKMVWIFY
jgi:kinesin family protein 6/9